MGLILAISIILVVNSAVNSEQQHTYFESKVRANISEAINICQKKGMELPNEKATESYLFENRQKFASEVLFWIPIKNSNFTQWWWISGHIYGGKLNPKQVERGGHDCVVMSTEEKTVDEMKCNQKTFGYICDFPEVTPCPFADECIHFHGRRLHLHSGRATWFEAMNECRENGGKLSSFSGMTLRKLADNLHDLVREHGRFYIGLVHSFWHQHNKSEFSAPSRYQWALDEPKPEKMCAVINTGTRRWKSAKCSEKHKFLCYSVTNAPPEKDTKEQVQMRNSTDRKFSIRGIPNLENGSWTTIAILVTMNISLATIYFFAGKESSPSSADPSNENMLETKKPRPKGQPINWEFLILWLVFIFFHVPHMPLLSLQTTLNGYLGVITAIVLHLSSWFECLYIPLIKKFNARVAILCCMVRLLFVGSNMFPAWYLLLPSAFLLGAARTTSDTLLHICTKRLKRLPYFLPNEPFSPISLLLYMIPVSIGFMVTFVTLNFVHKNQAVKTWDHRERIISNLTNRSFDDLLSSSMSVCGKEFCLNNYHLFEVNSVGLPLTVRYILIGALGFFPAIGIILSGFLSIIFRPGEIRPRWNITLKPFEKKQAKLHLLTIPCHILMWYQYTVWGAVFSMMVGTCYESYTVFSNMILAGIGVMTLMIAVYVLKMKRLLNSEKWHLLQVALKISIGHVSSGCYCILALEWNPLKHSQIFGYMHGVAVAISAVLLTSALSDIPGLPEELKTSIYLVREITVAVSAAMCCVFCYDILIYVLQGLIVISFISLLILFYRVPNWAKEVRKPTASIGGQHEIKEIFFMLSEDIHRDPMGY